MGEQDSADKRTADTGANGEGAAADADHGAPHRTPAERLRAAGAETRPEVTRGCAASGPPPVEVAPSRPFAVEVAGPPAHGAGPDSRERRQSGSPHAATKSTQPASLGDGRSDGCTDHEGHEPRTGGDEPDAPARDSSGRVEDCPRTESGKFECASNGEDSPTEQLPPQYWNGLLAANRWLDDEANCRRLEEIYKDLHRHPELAHQEERTIARVRGELEQAGLEVTEVPDGGLVCDFGEPGPDGWIVLTADMDALKITEQTNLEYASENPELMHACGHDAHTTMLLGAALALAEARAAGMPIPGIRFVWRRAEETADGANALEAAGVFDNVAMAAGLHIDPALPVGTVGIRGGYNPDGTAKDGVINWSSVRFDLEFSGPGGHTGHPEDTIKLARVMSDFVRDLEELFTFCEFGVEPAPGEQLTSEGVVGAMGTGDRPNVIAKTGFVRGTIRNRNDENRLMVPERLAALIAKYEEATGVTITIKERSPGVPPVINHPEAAERMARAAREVLGEDAVVESKESKGGDDFGVLAKRAPGIYAQPGSKGPESPPGQLHTPGLVVHLGVLPVGVKLLSAFAVPDGEQPLRPRPNNAPSQPGPGLSTALDQREVALAS